MKCNHYPILGMAGDYKFGGNWKIIKADMNTIVRQCVKCGEIYVSHLTKSNPEMYMSEKRLYKLNKDREANAVNMIQPIDPKTGKFNEEFGKHYGYNPLDTPSPKPVEDIKSDGEVDKKLKINKL